MNTYLKLGQWNAICDRCGFKFKSVELKKDWQGLMVCEHDFELRNQQDFLRVRPERIVPDWTRPRPADMFVDIPYVCTIEGSSSVIGRAIVGCALIGTEYAPWAPGPSATVGKAITGLAVTGNL